MQTNRLFCGFCRSTIPRSLARKGGFTWLLVRCYSIRILVGRVFTRTRLISTFRIIFSLLLTTGGIWPRIKPRQVRLCSRYYSLLAVLSRTFHLSKYARLYGHLLLLFSDSTTELDPSTDRTADGRRCFEDSWRSLRPI